MADVLSKISDDLNELGAQADMLIGLDRSIITQLSDLKNTVQQQQIDPKAAQAIIDHIDLIKGNLAKAVTEVQAATASNGPGTGTPTPTPQPAATVTQFSLAAAGPFVADTPFGFDVRALDVTGTTVTTYLGPAHFSSDVGGQSVPNDDYTFVPSDNGVHSFQATLPAGTHTITVTEAGNPAIIGTLTVVVNG